MAQHLTTLLYSICSWYLLNPRSCPGDMSIYSSEVPTCLQGTFFPRFWHSLLCTFPGSSSQRFPHAGELTHTLRLWNPAPGSVLVTGHGLYPVQKHLPIAACPRRTKFPSTMGRVQMGRGWGPSLSVPHSLATLKPRLLSLFSFHIPRSPGAMAPCPTRPHALAFYKFHSREFINPQKGPPI